MVRGQPPLPTTTMKKKRSFRIRRLYDATVEISICQTGGSTCTSLGRTYALRVTDTRRRPVFGTQLRPRAATARRGRSRDKASRWATLGGDWSAPPYPRPASLEQRVEAISFVPASAAIRKSSAVDECGCCAREFVREGASCTFVRSVPEGFREEKVRLSAESVLLARVGSPKGEREKSAAGRFGETVFARGSFHHHHHHQA